MEKENKKDEKKVEEKKVKKSIFEKVEEQKQKLEKLKIKKDNEIKKIILKSFDFLTEEETLKRFSQLSENEVFLEKIKDIILKEMEEEDVDIGSTTHVLNDDYWEDFTPIHH